jgi:tRNA-dihydrouridine synthase B
MSKRDLSPLSGPPIGPDTPWLAPLAGYSDLPFRRLCRLYGADCAVTEMVSAKGLIYRSPGTEALLLTAPDDAPLVLQLYGAEPEIMARAMDELLERGFRWFDLNAGCPAPKVSKTGCGAGMLRDEDARASLLAVAKVMIERAGPGCVGVKMRRGWRPGEDAYLELGERLADLGAGWLTLHPRWAKQGFGGVADWSCLTRLAERARVPVLASGDLLTARDGVRCLEQSGASGLMFARGALSDPAIFLRYKALRAEGVERGEQAELSDLEHSRRKQELVALIRAHVAFSREASPSEHLALLKMRSFIPRYLKGTTGARSLRKEVISCSSWEQLDALLDAFLAL